MNNKHQEIRSEVMKMYASNAFSKRRPDGWTERRRHFERLFEQTANKETKPARAERDSADKPKQ